MINMVGNAHSQKSDIMNTINKSTGYMLFQLRFGKSPHILPPFFEDTGEDNNNITVAKDILKQMAPIKLNTQNNLLTTKIDQAQLTNQHQSSKFPFCTRDHVILSTTYKRVQYKSNNNHCVAKFMPRYDSLYKITSTNKKHLTVTLDLPNNPQAFLVFHTSELLPFCENNDNLFPRHALNAPNPVTFDGEREYYIDKIVDE